MNKVGAPRRNQNRKNKTKEKGRIPLSLSISDKTEVSEGVYVDLRARFEEYLLAQGELPTEERIREVARTWAYEAWWVRLKQAEDEQAEFL